MNKEGFHLMTYQCRNGHEETIWNSRNGITPFIVGCQRCKQDSQHIYWNRDVYAPDHKPKKGDRIFIDLTLEKAKEYCRRFVLKYWDKRMEEMYSDKNNAVNSLAQSDMERFAPHTPDLIVVE